MENTCELKCNPIKTLEELFEWKPLTCNHSNLKSRSLKGFVPVSMNPNDGLKFQSLKNSPKVLVCHDMKGGYLEDCFIEGCSDPKAYNFVQWNLIDTFVYFSHYLITVPPPCWVHAAHMHGVPIIGTFITEWDDGAAICNKIFISRDSVDSFVDKLVALTFCHNFDGWLINIENVVEEKIIGNIIYFLQRLKRELKLAGNKDSQVIWYDSITKEGKLDWQNELNDLNSIFFDACDGIFLNYTWTAEHLTRSVVKAGDRIQDVYVGIDIFGRNCFGGGGFNTAAAVMVARELRLSVALFAIGWVYECHPLDQFAALSSKFWSALLPHFGLRNTISSLPIRTSFCPGFGKAVYSKGQIIREEPWHNISKQELQPMLVAVDGHDSTSIDTNYEALKWGIGLKFGRQSHCDEDAFQGGHCLSLRSTYSAIFPLFVCNIPTPEEMLVAIAFKDLQSSSLNLVFTYKEIERANYTHVMCSLHQQVANAGCPLLVREISEENFPEFEAVIGGAIRSDSTGSTDWVVKLFQISLNGRENTILKAISLTSDRPSSCKIGYFGCF